MTESLHQAARSGLEAIDAIVQQKESIEAELNRLRVDFMLLKQECEQLKQLNATLKSERDHYMRFSTEIVTQLNTINGVITDAVLKAKHVAFRPSQVPAPHGAPDGAHDPSNLAFLAPVRYGEK